MSKGIMNLENLLEKYSQEVNDKVRTILKKDVQKAKNDLKASSSRFGSRYAGGWTMTEQSSKFTTHFVISHKTPGLPHLLENGHVSRNGTGRTFPFVKGREHIAHVNDELQEKALNDIERAISEVNV